MLSKSEIKLINSLAQKKYRFTHKLFLAEGIKVIKEFLASHFELEKIYAETDVFFTSAQKIQMINRQELKKISQLKTPQVAVALFKIPEQTPVLQNSFSLALDGIRDPGNLGTIIRLCDWFGIDELWCSKDTVDCYNAKVVQATMGSLARVNCRYIDLPEMLEETSIPIFGAFMEGSNIYTEKKLTTNGVLVLGNEAHGISKETEALITKKLAIPQFGELKKTESLNVATASAILLSEFKRREL